MAQYRKRKEAKKLEDEGLSLMNKRKTHIEKKINLTASDQEFFDVLRMRSTEVRAAEQRALAFAQRLWADEKIRNNKEVNKLITIKIISSLTKWFFDVLSKHLIGYSTADLKGEEALDTAMVLRSKAASFSRKKKGVRQQIKTLQKSPQPWAKLGLLSPALRISKKIFRDKMLVLTDRLQDLQGEESSIKSEAAEVERLGKRLLPQIPLTVRIVSNYMLKISASRSKKELLARMDEGSMLATMESTDNDNHNLISKENMSLLLKSMRQKMLSNGSTVTSNQLMVKEMEDELELNALNDLVDEELRMETYRQSNVDYNTYMGSSLKITGYLSFNMSHHLKLCQYLYLIFVLATSF
jgi:hypothetical protein